MYRYFKQEFDASIEALNSQRLDKTQAREAYWGIYNDFSKRIREGERDMKLLHTERETLDNYFRSSVELNSWAAADH